MSTNLSDIRTGSTSYEYRVVRYNDPRYESGYYYAIHEVQWSNRQIVGVSMEAVPAAGSNLREVLSAMYEALQKPVLDAEELKEIPGTFTADFWNQL